MQVCVGRASRVSSGAGASDWMGGSRRGRPWRRLASTVAAGAVLLAGAVVVGPASAASLGPHHGSPESTGSLGAYVAESDGHQVYCMDSGAPAPWGTTSGPSTVTDLTSHTGAPLPAESLAKLNYVLAKWGDSAAPDVTAAVAMFVWSVADADTYNSHGMNGDDWYITRAPEGNRPAILANLGTMRADADANAAVAPSVTVSIAMRDQFAGTVTVAASPSALSGGVVLTNATFADGATSKQLGSGTYPIVGTPVSGAPEYQITAKASYSGAGLGARVNLYDTPGAQRLLAAGTTAAVTDAATTPVIPLNFQPVIGTTVASTFVPVGQPFVDTLNVTTVGAGDWTVVGGKPVPLTAEGTLYGPFTSRPVESEKVPAGAPVAGRETLILDHGTGTYSSSGTVHATTSGYYTWVWGIDKAKQGENSRYIRDSFTDAFGRVAETHVTPFRPEATSKADTRVAKPGDAGTDTIVVSSKNGAWLKVDGQPVPVVLDGTAYQVPGALPPTEGMSVPKDAGALGHVQVTATGPGTYTSPEIVQPNPGFVTWVWRVNLDSQLAQYRDYIEKNWADAYGIPVETTSVRWPTTITSEVREYNVHAGGRAFDTINISGLPEDHGDFTGDGYWDADLDRIEHTVYGPFDTDTVLTDDLDLTGAPTLTTLTTPARNGTYKLGYTDADQIRPTKPGYYVIVSTFDGDDRAQPYRSSPGDILERFYVPAASPAETEVTVTTKATPTAQVGDPIRDIATVSGTVPAGSYLIFRAYGPYQEQPAAGDTTLTPFFTSDHVPVNGPGDYPSGQTRVEKAGLVFWVETLYSPDGKTLAEGFIGAPGETTVVTATPPVPPAQPAGELAETGSSRWWAWGAGLLAAAFIAIGAITWAVHRHRTRQPDKRRTRQQ